MDKDPVLRANLLGLSSVLTGLTIILLSTYSRALQPRLNKKQVPLAELSTSSNYLHSKIQTSLHRYLSDHKTKLAAVSLAEVSSGNIIALATAADNSTIDLSRYAGFPAASIYKIVSTIILLENYSVAEVEAMVRPGSCKLNKLHSPWAYKKNPKHSSFAKAYATSCNGFYAQAGLSLSSLAQLQLWSHKLGWNRLIPNDLNLAPSSIDIPIGKASSLYTIGRHYAGFGTASLSLFHGLWLALVLARDGKQASLRYYKSTSQPSKPAQKTPPLISESTATIIRNFMHSTVRYGTARSSFASRRYRHIRSLAGGKTGSLYSYPLDAKVTWFIGMLPYHQPEVVVSAVVAYQKKWTIKASQLGAEALYLWKKHRYIKVAKSKLK